MKVFLRFSLLNYTVKDFLYGSQNLTFQENEHIFLKVQEYIVKSRRFFVVPRNEGACLGNWESAKISCCHKIFFTAVAFELNNMLCVSLLILNLCIR